MSALPSFVELMASLGLSADSDVSISENNQARPRRSASPPHPHFYVPPTSVSRESDESPAIIVSRVERETAPKGNETRRRASSGNIRATRFNPYASSSRRGSTSSISDFSSEDELNGASAPTSRRSSCTSIKSAAPRKKERVSRRASEQLNIVTSAASCTPISSFARRRSPYSSPTSPSFSTRSRSSPTELLTPVSLPTLPPLIAETFASYSFPQIADGDITHPSGSPSLSPMSTSVGTDEDMQFMRHHHSGVRISSVCRTGTFQHIANRRQIQPLA